MKPWATRWQGDEFFAFPGLWLGRKTDWAESLCFLPSHLAAWVGAAVALQQSRTLRPGIYTIARFANDVYPALPRRPALNLNKSQWTFAPRKSGHFKPRFCGLFVPLLTLDLVSALNDLARRAIRNLFPAANIRLLLFFFVLAAGLLVPLYVPSIDSILRIGTIAGIIIGLVFGWQSSRSTQRIPG